ncbi:MAG: phosphoribosylaminoimidazolecarboxamide formyltransferase / cyclohydrolase [Verrucomicrobiota bacterium]|jgi:phosphoribosylaminoimidazolecarboxamide formyltransferase/IMP cyclohydrolase|nr:phosphoribosylaminoimidazolecarboxamide formyltransferase / cyclohydrolase [Verrucomicrobiota bacterium]MDK2963127.1 phosphoribosylaminoimidazolecarboxamide formyltransferase / cyclohydrolase [Verrucomicrobiota bacterium]
MSKIERALLSVSDKTGIVDFAKALTERGVELLSTGGTANALRDAGIPVKDVSEFTGFPEMLGGRVKTLTPQIHAGLLHLRDSEEHTNTMKKHGLKPIDLVCVTLYPFEATVANPEVTLAEAIEQIDIGGPAMIRSAAKNMKFVTVITEPADYSRVLESMDVNGGDTTEELRFELGQKVFARVAEYNAAIAGYLAEQMPSAAPRPFVKTASKGVELRYGENSHQRAWLYTDATVTEACIAHTDVLHGKEMSYNNYVDGEGALEAVKELTGKPGVAVIKHTNPCGYATGTTLAEAFEAAWSGDPVSAFGSVIAVTEKIDLATAECLKGRFIEALIAPDFDADALELLKTRSKNIRLLKLRAPLSKPAPRKMVKDINGGILVQDVDTELITEWKDVTQTAFDPSKRALAEFGIAAAKHTKSNAIMIVQEYKPGQFRVLGMGAGQPNRVDSLRKLAVPKAVENLKLQNPGITEEKIAKTIGDCIFVSEAFFPFADSIDEAHAAGARFIVQPGGSIRDNEVIAACDKYGIAMAFTGMRHFKH